VSVTASGQLALTEAVESHGRVAFILSPVVAVAGSRRAFPLATATNEAYSSDAQE